MGARDMVTIRGWVQMGGFTMKDVEGQSDPKMGIRFISSA